ncbi:MAG: aromatic-ring-hydroxylating dioxygenase subunit beta [Immundisolibacteraceae bacterium]|nr:aromatic-ring-hydroxylating dioxygenase subunit beta [Immundisolibacteraceae bacterium]
MDKQQLRYEVEELIHAYVQCIDDDDLEVWPDFFTDKCDYKVIPRENVDQNLPVSVMFCDSKGMLRDRIVALRNANVFAPHFYRHLVSNVRVLGEDNGVISVQSNYLVMQTLLDGETKIYNAGKYLDKIVREGDSLKFQQKHCVFDTYRIQTLMVTPI